MKNILINRYFVGTAVVFSSIFLGVTTDFHNKNHVKPLERVMVEHEGIIAQDIVATTTHPIEVARVYYQDKLLAVLHDEARLDTRIQEVYNMHFAERFKKTRLSVSDDIVIVKELSTMLYANVDDQIFEYLQSKQLFAVEANKITFSNGQTIYVQDLKDFEEAKEIFIQNFVDGQSYTRIKENRSITPLSNLGHQVIKLEVDQRVKQERAYTSADNVLVDTSEILSYLSYGKDATREDYTTQEYDTIAGIASTHGMTARQLVSINQEILKSENQLISPGMTLNITPFNSTLTVKVTHERLAEALIYPEEPEYREDDTIPEGTQVVDVVESMGVKAVRYNDIYANGKSVDSVVIDSKTISEPTRGVIRVGTYIEPTTGSGQFRWPLDNAYLLCGFGCYPGHRGVDFSTYGTGYGPIRAADRGVVVENQPGIGWGNYIKIDHGNGYQTLYAHMNGRGYIPVGATVKKGEVIGYVGMSGTTTYPHVHFEIYEHGNRVDACNFLGC